MRIRNLLLAMCCLPLIVGAQNPTTTFGCVTASITGSTNQGNCTGADVAKGITTDGFGNSYVVGNFTGTATFGSMPMFTSAGGTDVFLEVYNRIGTPLWAVQSGGTGTDDAKSVAVYPDGVGGVFIYVTGYFTNAITFNGLTGAPWNLTSVVAGNRDMYMVKYRFDGSIVWARSFGGTAAGDFTQGYDIAVSNNNSTNTVDIWISGSLTGTVNFGGAINIVSLGGQNGFIANFQDIMTPPNATWVNGILSTSLVAQALGICPDPVGNVYLTGYWLYGNLVNFGLPFNGIAPYGNDDGFVSVYDGFGNIQNVMHFGHVGNPTQGTSAQGVAVGENGGIYVVGAFTNTTTFQLAPLISLVSTGGPVIGSDAFLMRLNPATFAVDYVQQMSSPTADDVARRVVTDHCGRRAYVSGDFIGTENFGNAVTLTTGLGVGESSFIVDFDIVNPAAALAFHATQAGGSSGNPKVTIAYDIAVNSVEDVEYCGSFSCGTCVINPAPPSGNLLNAIGLGGGVNDGFMARWDDSYWPALETTGQAINQGVSTVDCTDYAVGDMINNNVTFGTLPPLSTVNGFADVYLLTTDKYANYTGFKQLMNGTSTETSVDLVSSASNHYVAGNAVTSSTGPAVTFTFDAVDSYVAGANYGSNAIVMKTNLTGTTGWGTSVRPGGAGLGGSATGMGVAYDTSGNVFFCGYFSGNVTVYNVGNTAYGVLSSNGSNDIFVIKYNSAGAVQWAKKIGGSGDDKANGISMDPGNAYYYITGQVSNTVTVAQGLAHAHTATGVYSDGFVLRGNASTASGGAAINDAFWTTATTNDKGVDVFDNGTTEVYVTGIKTANKVYIARYDLTGTASPAGSWWNLISTGGTAYGNDIILGRNGYVYVSGELGSTSVTFGSLPAITSPNVYGGYIVGLTSWTGIATWETQAYTNAKFCNGLAEDVGYLMSDHGFICLIGGANDVATGSHAYLQKATEEGLEFSSRHANPALTGNGSLGYENETMIYPNPFSQNATLRLGEKVDLSTPVSILVFDVTGRIVIRKDEVIDRETEITSDEMTSGIYFYQVVQNGNILSAGKMMVSK